MDKEPVTAGEDRQRGSVGSGGVEILPADIDLKLRMGGRAGRRGSIKQDAILQAEKAIEKVGEKYIEVAQSHVAALIGQLIKVKRSPRDNNDALTELAMTAREIKGQAKTCGYSLLTQVADSLYRFVADRKALTERQLAFVEAHIGVIQNIVAHKLRGDGGAVGAELLRSLAVAKAKLEDH
jgi:HPt (histidine-containing phosphotransfer) domain-containing protein